MAEDDELRALLRSELVKIAADLDHRAQRQDLGHAGPSDLLQMVAQSFERLAAALGGDTDTRAARAPDTALPDAGDPPVYELGDGEPDTARCEVCEEDAVIHYDGIPTCVSCGAEQVEPGAG